MAGTKEVKNRIKSIQSTHQITKAMEIVSTTKFNRLSVAVKRSKPYSQAVQAVLENISTGVKSENNLLFDGRKEVNRIAIILMTSDSGLCGSFNSSTMKEYERLRNANVDKDIATIVIGKKGRDYCRKRKYQLNKIYISLSLDKIESVSQEIGEIIVADFIIDKYDEVYIVYNVFVSALVSKLQTQKLIPIDRLDKRDDREFVSKEYIFEPNAEELLNILLPKYLKVQLYQAFLDNLASEHSSRKNAMKSATENAEEIISELTIKYNRQRQGAITQEITEIVGGVNALS